MKIKKLFCFVLGAIFLSIGAIGIVLPLLPTTPFVIISVFCFGKSSKRVEEWILRNKYFGSYIENYRNKVGVPIKVKIRSVLFLWIALIISMIYLQKLLMILILLIVGIAVTLHIYFLRTKKE
ncbi:MAG: YbaN family protein [Methanobrevibacter sp.]|jgi:uncharacterized membrane protein YbaN (DUF454 family)|nr:YbaN family protein [Methanobrevibacter sp.]